MDEIDLNSIMVNDKVDETDNKKPQQTQQQSSQTLPPHLHNLIHNNFDITFKCRNSSYRIYGIDYSGYFTFKHKDSNLLYNSKKHWSDEQKVKPLLL